MAYTGNVSLIPPPTTTSSTGASYYVSSELAPDGTERWLTFENGVCIHMDSAPPSTGQKEALEPMSAHQLVLHTIERCEASNLVSLDHAFKSLMGMTATDLARMPGSPAAVMLAQTLSYIKTTNKDKLREPLLADQNAFNRVLAIVNATPLPKKEK